MQIASDLNPLAALGVAPLPVRLAWNADAIAPIEALVLGLFAFVAAAHGLAAGLVAAALITFSPNIVAHATLATTDVSFTAAFVACLAALIVAVRRQTWWSATLVAIALGVALATKYSSLGP